jgi:lipid A ethanolaminephosphotransferase
MPSDRTPRPDAGQPYTPRPSATAGLLGRVPRPSARVEQIVAVASLFWVLAANRDFVIAALRQRPLVGAADLGFLATLLLLLWALHVLLVLPLATRHTVKPLVALLTVAAAAGSYFIGSFGVVLDPSMLRNVLRTDLAETRELLTGTLLMHLLVYALVPLLLLWRIEVQPTGWRRALLGRAALAAVALGALVGGVWTQYQPLSSWFRQHTDVRYLVTPANIVWSTSRVLAGEARGAARPREVVAADVQRGPSWAARTRPLVVVLVVGETARAANWGLSGYARQTTPELARRGVVNFTQVSSCGTNTEVSVPCLFAPVGRRGFDETRIRGQESLLHVLDRAGVSVHWRDNQSGCKGVCDGLPQDAVTAQGAPGLCEGGRCLDEGLIRDLPERLRAARGTSVWVLHMLGNHGPSYWRRYPPRFATFRPECRDDDLQHCSIEQIVNAYDNALLYTDHVLARTIDALQAAAGEVDSALVYVSDHGESLGERGLFLHGLPHAIAPPEQRQVPMVWWSSPGLERAAGLLPGCLVPALQRQATAPLSHDHLFHTVLGLLDLQTQVLEPSLDLVGSCRRATAP